MRRILVADDHPICIAALGMAIHAVDPAILVDNATTLAEVEVMAAAERMDLILLDLVLPDVDGFGGLVAMRARHPQTPVAIVSSRDENRVIGQARRLGAAGFLSKAAPMSEMISAIRVMLEGGQWFAADIPHETDADDDEMLQRIGSLSVAQLRVLRAISSGKQNKQIAYELDLSEPTVKSHLAAIFKKLKVSNRTQAVLLYGSLQ